jgi:DNA primase
VFNKGNELYGLLEARQSIRERGHVLVTEGYMDVVALAQLGFPNSVATLGTATSGIHVQKLLRQTDHIVYSFDGDAAGRKAAWRALESALPFAADDKRISFLFLPAEHDPDSFVRAEGTAAFDAEIAKALPLSAFLVRELANRNAMDSAEGRSAMLSQATPLLKLLPAGALRLQIMRLLAQSADMNPADVERITGLEAVAPRGGNKNYRPGARTARAATRSKERQVMDALVRDLGQYSAVRDTFLLWREDLEVMPTSVRRSDDAATLLDLVDWMELQMRSGLSPKASDLAAFAQENASIAQLLADNMREEADAVADPDALRAACQELRSTQLGAWANACIAANDLPAYRSLTERARNEGVRLRAVGV